MPTSTASRWTLPFASRFRLHVKGEARGVKVDGGILELIMRAIEVECLPGDIPERIEVDVTDLGINDALRVSDLPVSAKVKILEDAGSGRCSRHFGEGRSCCLRRAPLRLRRRSCCRRLPSPKS